MNFLSLKHTYIESYEGSFDFDLYLFDEKRYNRIFALKAKSPLTRERFAEIQNLCLKGLVLQFKDEYLDEFKKLKIRDDIYRDNEKQIELEKTEAKNLVKKTKLEDFDVKEVLKSSVENSNFEPLILRAQKEISYFSIRVSQLQSDLIDFISNSLTRDSSLTRGAAFCYFLCKKIGVVKEIDILEVLTAYLLKDIGLTQIMISGYSPEDYSKHPAFSTMLLRRMDIKLSDNITKMIMESHERYDGLGFPLGKKEQFIYSGSKIVNLCDFIIENTYKVEPKINFYTCLRSVVNGRSLNNEVRKYPEEFISALKTFI